MPVHLTDALLARSKIRNPLTWKDALSDHFRAGGILARFLEPDSQYSGVIVPEYCGDFTVGGDLLSTTPSGAASTLIAPRDYTRFSGLTLDEQEFIEVSVSIVDNASFNWASYWVEQLQGVLDADSTCELNPFEPNLWNRYADPNCGGYEPFDAAFARIVGPVTRSCVNMWTETFATANFPGNVRFEPSVDDSSGATFPREQRMFTLVAGSERPGRTAAVYTSLHLIHPFHHDEVSPEFEWTPAVVVRVAMTWNSDPPSDMYEQVFAAWDLASDFYLGDFRSSGESSKMIEREYLKLGDGW